MSKRDMFRWAAIPAALVFVGQIIPTLVWGWGVNFSTAARGAITIDHGLVSSSVVDHVAWLGWPTQVISHVLTIAPIWHFRSFPITFGVFLAAVVFLAGFACLVLYLFRTRECPQNRLLVCGFVISMSGALANSASMAVLGGVVDWVQWGFTLPMPFWPSSSSYVLDVSDMAISCGLVLIGLALMWGAVAALSKALAPVVITGTSKQIASRSGGLTKPSRPVRNSAS